MKKIAFILLLIGSFGITAKGLNGDTLYINPNPCDTLTNIHFVTSQTDTVSLEVFDVLGQTTHAFFQNTILPSGSYSINFITTLIPSGIYFVRLKISSTVITKKLIVDHSLVGLEEQYIAVSEINIFPNPFINTLNIEYSGQKTIQLIDESGKLILQTKINSNNIIVNDVLNGIYILRVVNDENKLIVNKKIIKS